MPFLPTMEILSTLSMSSVRIFSEKDFLEDFLHCLDSLTVEMTVLSVFVQLGV